MHPNQNPRKQRQRQDHEHDLLNIDYAIGDQDPARVPDSHRNLETTKVEGDAESPQKHWGGIKYQYYSPTDITNHQQGDAGSKLSPPWVPKET